MTVEKLFKITKGIDRGVPKAEIILYLTKPDHNKLQEEVYKMKDPTLSSYKPQPVFQVELDKVLFILRSV